jgi:hypothetical protein
LDLTCSPLSPAHIPSGAVHPEAASWQPYITSASERIKSWLTRLARYARPGGDRSHVPSMTLQLQSQDWSLAGSHPQGATCSALALKESAGPDSPGDLSGCRLTPLCLGINGSRVAGRPGVCSQCCPSRSRQVFPLLWASVSPIWIME